MRDSPLSPADELGAKIKEGQDAVEYLWHVPDDPATREKLGRVLEQIKDLSARKGRREMPKLCDELRTALKASPSPQQVDMLHSGFERLQKLWQAAKTGLM